MKLFQKLLLGPVAVGLLSPLAASASEANLDAVTSYVSSNSGINRDSFKPLSTKNPLLAGGEGLNHSHDDSDFSGDTFSSTTSASFYSNFAIGSIDGTASSTINDEKVGVIYDYGIALSTSFTGDDSLDVELVAGRGDLRLTELDFNGSGGAAGKAHAVLVDSISYTKQLGDRTTVFFGNGTPGSALYNSACVYGGNATTTLADCGQATSAIDVDAVGTALGASFDLDNGFTAAVAYEGEGSSSDGLMTEEGVDALGAQLAYTSDNYGVSYTFANIDNNDGAGALTTNKGVSTYNAINAYYSPDAQNLPSVSIGYEWAHDDSAASSADQTTNYFVGLQWDEVGPGSLGAAIGTKTPTAESADDLMMYEAFYAYNYADGITITPLIFVKENSGSTSDETGIVVKSTFEF